MRYLLAFDKFKGTLTASEASDIVAAAIRQHEPDADIRILPMADGGEGTADALMSALGGRVLSATVTGPDGAPADAEYVLLPDGSAAFDMATCAGLTLMERPDPLIASTRGVGELISRLSGNILLGLGGSATCDLGIGMAEALGFTFLSSDGRTLPATAASLSSVDRIIPPEKPVAARVTCLADVDTPLLGLHGAVRVFGTQKGVTPELMPRFEHGFRNMALVIARDLGVDVSNVHGAGAAGGLGAAAVAFLNATVCHGADYLMELCRFDSLLASADVVITGEGRLDGQSGLGKVTGAVAARARSAGVPCYAMCGAVTGDAELPFSGVFAATDGNRSMDELKRTCRDDLARAALAFISETAKPE